MEFTIRERSLLTLYNNFQERAINVGMCRIIYRGSQERSDMVESRCLETEGGHEN
jgi:hypothetical protein